MLGSLGEMNNGMRGKTANRLRLKFLLGKKELDVPLSPSRRVRRASQQLHAACYQTGCNPVLMDMGMGHPLQHHHPHNAGSEQTSVTVLKPR